MNLVAPAFDEFYQNSIILPDLVDIDRCPARFLQFLSENIGVLPTEDVFDQTMPVFLRRIELGKMKDSHIIRSTEYSFLRILKYLHAFEYGIFYPWHNIGFLDVHPIDGWAPRNEVNDVMELLAPQPFDISFMADGIVDTEGNVEGSRVTYTLPVHVIRSRVKCFWNGQELEIHSQHPDSNLTSYTFSFDRTNDTFVTNFIPLIGDSLIVVVAGDPFYRISYRTEDASYWRPGVTEVFADVSPLLRRNALEDRRPAGTLLYLSFILRMFVTKCFPAIPEIDYTRTGYAPIPPPQEISTFHALAPCDDPDPLFPQFTTGYGYEGAFELTGKIEFGRSRPLFASRGELPDFQVTSVA